MRINKKWFILIILLAAFAFRLILLPLGFHVDILSIAGWGQWLYKNGPLGFYDNNIWVYSWPTQLPLVNLVYLFAYFLYEKLVWFFAHMALTIATYRLAPTYMLWFFDFVKWFGTALYDQTSFLFGYLLSLKLIAVITDITIAAIIYFLAKTRSIKWALFLGGMYLFLPFSWYLSSLWGQYDQLSYLFLLAAFLAIYKRFLILAVIIFTISFQLKPTSLIFAPLFIWMFVQQKPTLGKIFLSLFVASAFFLITVMVFTDKDLFYFMNHELIPKVFYKAEFRLSTNSFNFWHIFIGNSAQSQDWLFLIFPAKIWGYLAFITLNIYAFKNFGKVILENIYKSMFIIGTGSWLFLTNMLERYFFAGLLSLLLLCIYKPNLLKYFLIVSSIFWLNLYHGWWFPEGLNWIKSILIWEDGMVTRLLSILNVIIFLRVFVLLRK